MQTGCKAGQGPCNLRLSNCAFGRPSGGEASSAHLCSGVDIFPAEDAVAEGSGRVVVDELQHLEAGHPGSLQHGSALGLVEKGWHGDDCIFNGLFCGAQKSRMAPTASLRPAFPDSVRLTEAGNSLAGAYRIDYKVLTGLPCPLLTKCQ